MTPKQLAAEQAALQLRIAVDHINAALALMEGNGLNLENYPEYWHDFAEHPSELSNMIITDGEELQLEVGN